MNKGTSTARFPSDVSTANSRRTPKLADAPSVEKLLENIFTSHHDKSLESAEKSQQTTSTEKWNLFLPACYRNKDQELKLPSQDLGEFLQTELNLERLDRIFDWLWIAGRPMPPRALHYQIFLGRDIIVVHRLDMHLLWIDGHIYMTPLPRYLLVPNFWKEHLSCQDGCNSSGVATSGPRSPSQFCQQQNLRRIATGLLFSYAGLVVNEYDFEIAQDLKLLPKDVTWLSFRALCRDILSIHLLAHQIDRRFVFGELRLDRLNLILQLKGSPEGYKLRYPNYAAFWTKNLQWVAAIIGYILFALTAMQVGLATSVLSNSDTFQALSYGFTILAIVGPIALLFGILLVLLFFMALNLQRTRRFKARRLEKLFKTDSEQ